MSFSKPIKQFFSMFNIDHKNVLSKSNSYPLTFFVKMRPRDHTSSFQREFHGFNDFNLMFTWIQFDLLCIVRISCAFCGLVACLNGTFEPIYAFRLHLTVLVYLNTFVLGKSKLIFEFCLLFVFLLTFCLFSLNMNCHFF